MQGDGSLFEDSDDDDFVRGSNNNHQPAASAHHGQIQRARSNRSMVTSDMINRDDFNAVNSAASVSARFR